jgi:hypothetical protein
MKEWVAWFIQQQGVNLKEDLLCFDQHRSHLNEEILAALRSKGIDVIPFPKGAAAELSILDNSLQKRFL